MEQKTRNHLICALTLILLLSPVPIFSQGAASSLSGIVTNPYGIVIPGAKVVAKLRQAPPSGQSVIETETDERGQFALPNLLAGIYEVRVSDEGTGGEIKKIVTIPKGRSIVVEIELILGCSDVSPGRDVATENDKAEVVRLTLIEAITSKLGLLMKEQKGQGIILSTRNIRSEWLKSVEGVKITLMGQARIQRKANREGDFLYMSFPEVRVRGACIAVTVANTWAVATHSKKVYLSGGGYTYEYRKHSGQWVGKFVGGWIS